MKQLVWIKIALISLIVGIAAAAAGALLYIIDHDTFWAFLWFLFIGSFLRAVLRTLAAKRKRITLHLIALTAAIGWMLSNEIIFNLLAENINTNPYGEYFIEQFQFRLSLSLFILKFIQTTWLTDLRLLIVVLLYIFALFTSPPLFKIAASKLPQRHFEFIVHTCHQMKETAIVYCAPQFTFLIINTLLWCLAAFLLRFDNFVILTAIMAISTLTPGFGLFLAAALSIVYVESGIFMLQMGGIFIATASVWFIDYTIFKERMHRYSPPMTTAMLLSLPIGYALFSFPGLFAAGAITFLCITIGVGIFENRPLLHQFTTPTVEAKGR